jgi:hypothetical protein
MEEPQKVARRIVDKIIGNPIDSDKEEVEERLEKMTYKKYKK